MIWLYTILLATAFYYLGSRTLVTRWFWSRMPTKVYEFLSCPMCAPFWYTLAITTTALAFGYRYPGLKQWDALLVTPFCAIALTPMCVGLIEWSLTQLYNGSSSGKPEADA